MSRSSDFELDLDEFGIYRPNSSEDGADIDADEEFNIDDQGIWRDPWTQLNVRPDSGLGTVDRKSSSTSTIHHLHDYDRDTITSGLQDEPFCDNQEDLKLEGKTDEADLEASDVDYDFGRQTPDNGGDMSYLLRSTGVPHYQQQSTEGDTDQGNLPQQSLLEFEHLEAAMQKSDISDDHGDLIGAYLRGLEEQESAEQLTTWDGSDLTYTDTPSQVSKFNYYLNTTDSNTSIIDHYKQGTSADGDHSKNSTLNDSVLDHSYNDHYNLSEQNSLDHNQQGQGSPLQSISRSSSISKIPMLRCRSPNMSRPGSTISNRSYTRKSSQSPPERNRRKLPAPPAYKTSVSSSTTNSCSVSPGNETPIGSSNNGSALERRDLELAASKLSRGHGRRLSRDSSQDGEITSLTSTQQSDLPEYQSGANYRRPQSRSGRPQPKVRLKPRPASAEASRPTSAQAPGVTNASMQPFRIRGTHVNNQETSSTLSTTKRQPLKANHSLLDIRHSGLQQEDDVVKSSNTTVAQLQQEYNTLLQKYAQAENTIDTLRIGAKIPVHVELTATGSAAGAGSMVGSSALGSVGSMTGLNGAGSMGGLSRHNSITSMVSSQLQNNIQPHHSASQVGSRPPSRQSLNGPSGATSTVDLNHEFPTTNTGIGVGSIDTGTDGIESSPETEIENFHDLGAESMRLSLLAKAKAVQDQADAFKILLDENHLTLDDQQVALANIKNGYEKIQADYREASEKHARQKRRNSVQAMEDGFMYNMPQDFDSNQELKGELYKLNIQLDDMEQRVGDNLTMQQSTSRVPFQNSPMKADHSIDTTSSRPKRERTRTLSASLHSDVDEAGTLRDQAKPPSALDEKIKQVDNGYNSLMERYHHLKELRKTPERDQEVNRLIKDLRGIYDAAPHDNKPNIPLEVLATVGHDQSRHNNTISGMPSNRGHGGLGSATSGRSCDDLIYDNEQTPDIRDIEQNETPRHTLNDSYRLRKSSTCINKPQDGPIYKKHMRSGSMSSISDSFYSHDHDPTKTSTTTLNNKSLRRDADKDSGYLGSEVSRRNILPGQLNRGTFSKSSSQLNSHSGTQDLLDSSDEEEEDEGEQVFIEKPFTQLKNRHSQLADVPQTVLQSHSSFGIPAQNNQHRIATAPENRRGERSSESNQRFDYSSDYTDDEESRDEKPKNKKEQIRHLEKKVSQLKKQLQNTSISGNKANIPGGGKTWQGVGAGNPGLQQPQLMYTYPLTSEQVNLHPDASQPTGMPAANGTATDYPYYQSYGIQEASYSNLGGAPQNIEDFRAKTTSSKYLQPLNMQQHGNETPDFTYSPHPYLNPLRHHPHSTTLPASGGLDERFFQPSQPQIEDFIGHDPMYREAYREDHYMTGANPNNYYDDQMYEGNTYRSSRGMERYRPREGDYYRRRSGGGRTYHEDDPYSGYHSDGGRKRENRYNRLRRQYLPERDYNPAATEHLFPRQYPNRTRFRVPGQNNSPGQPYRPIPVHGQISNGNKALPVNHQNLSCCPMCGGTGMHSHGSYVYPPVGQPINTLQPALQANNQRVPQTHPISYAVPQSTTINHPDDLNNKDVSVQQPTHYLVPANNGIPIPVTALSNHSPSSPVRPQQNGTLGLPVQTISPTKSSSMVRYYVREYGGGSDNEKRKKKHRKRSNTVSHRIVHVNRTSSPCQDSDSDSDPIDLDLNDSLRVAIKTAKHLHNMSRQMRTDLSEELFNHYDATGGSYLE